MKNPKALIAAIFIFVMCLVIGFWLAQYRPLWNDEYYSQVASIDGISYVDQFSGRISEGGNAPLFYSLQKLFLQLVHYQTSAQWPQGHWHSDSFSQILLRVNPVFFMSLSVGLVFYYFCRRYSLGTAFYSLFIYLSSYMLWAYWAQARPYALLVFLTTVQSVILLKKADKSPGSNGENLWMILAGTNILLGLTSILSLGEILAVSVLWWALKERDWKKYLFVTLLPMAIVLFYYVHAPKYQFFFGLSPQQLIWDNISRERFDVLFVFFIALIFKKAIGEEILKPLAYVIFMVLVLASSGVLLWLFALHAQASQGFVITSRYFIYLTPIGVITTTIVTVSIFKSLSRYHWIQWAFAGLIAFLFARHLLKIMTGAALHLIRGGFMHA